MGVYNRVNWTEAHPLSATNFNIMDAGIKALADLVSVQRVLLTLASGNFVKADYPGLVALKLLAIGGGGGGGGNSITSSGQVSGGGGGASGAWAMAVIPASALAASEAWTRGAGGAGGFATVGSAGGQTTFGSFLTAQGGGGGSHLAPFSTFPRMAKGGIPNSSTPVGDIWSKGTQGHSLIALRAENASIEGGAGGESILASGGHSELNISANSGRYGSGGGGAAVFGAFSDESGGSGGNGIIVVDLYF